MRVLIVLLGSLSLLVGCGQEQGGKASHFEDDHPIAPHWPTDLADAANKIRFRLDAADQTPDSSLQIAEEVADLVSWVPELAADTNFADQDWMALDDAAQSLSANLRSAGNELTAANRQQTAALCELIEQSLPNIPDQLSPRTRAAL